MIKHDGTPFSVLSAALFDAEPARTIAVTSAGSACFVSCTDGETRCVGRGTSGQLGDGTTTTSKTALVTAIVPSAEVCPIIK
jgi:hypothetical protein